MKFTRKTRIIIIVIALIIVAGAVFASLYFFTDMFKSPEQSFFKYAGKAAMLEGEYDYQDALNEMQIASTKSYNANYTIGVVANTNSYSSISNVASQLDKMKIGLDVKSNPSQNKASYNVSLKYDDANIASAELVKDNDLYGVKSDLIDEKYVAIKNANLKDLVEKLGGDSTNIPDKIELLDLYKLLYVSKEDQEHIVETFSKALENSFPKENYTKADNITTTVNGASKTTTTYTLSVTQKDFYNAVINILQTAKNDDTTLNLIVEKFNMFLDNSLLTKMALANRMNVITTKGYREITTSTTMPTLNKENLRQAIDKVITELQSQLSYANSATKLDFVIYVENGKTVRMELKQGSTVAFAADFYEENGKKHVVIYGATSSYSTMSYSYATKLSKVMEIEYQITKNGNYKKMEMTTTAYDSYGDKQGKIGFEITTDGKTGEGVNTQSIKYSVETEEIQFAINLEGKIDYTSNVEIASLNKANSNILNDMSKEEIETLAKKIEENVVKNGKDISEKVSTLLKGTFTKAKSYTDILKDSVLDL